MSQEIKAYQVSCVVSFKNRENTTSVNQLTEGSKSKETVNIAVLFQVNIFHTK